jgi:hypothetical protein
LLLLVEFQKILDHRGWAPRSHLYPFGHLGLARAAVISGDAAKARKAYEAFFTLWKDADDDLPILLAVKQEYAKLNKPSGTPLERRHPCLLSKKPRSSL